MANFKQVVLCVISHVCFSLVTCRGQTLYCTSSQGTTTGNAPPYPTLPDQFSSVIEGNIVNRGYTLTGYEYVDTTGNRTATKIMYRGLSYTTIFDYGDMQVFNIQGNANCTVANLKGGLANLFDNVAPNGMPHVFSTVGALHFQQAAGPVYINRTVVRGISVDHWQSCHYWQQLSANFTLDYYFSDSAWKDPILKPHIPVRAEVKGVHTSSTGTRQPFHHYYDYFDFQPSVADPTVFQTPLGVVCPGRKHDRPLPDIPPFFHIREEITQSNSFNISYLDLWYHGDYKLIRYDYLPIVPVAAFPHSTSLSVIEDYNTGITYTMDKTNGKCSVMPGVYGQKHYVHQGASTSYVSVMDDPQQLFTLNANYTYIGKRSVRGLPCIAFTGVSVVVVGSVNITFNVTAFYLDDGVQMIPDEGLMSTHKNRLVQMLASNKMNGTSMLISVSSEEYGDQFTDVKVFDVTPCYNDGSLLLFTVRFQGQYESGLNGQLVRQSYHRLADWMNVSQLRIQDVSVNYDNTFIYISAKLLDRSPYLAQFRSVVNKTVLDSADDISFTSSQVQSEAQCAEACIIYTNFTCNSFDYCSKDTTRTCRLSKLLSSDGKRGLAQSNTCDHYSRTVNGPMTPEISLGDAYINLQQKISQGSVTLNVQLRNIPIMYGAVDVSLTYGTVYPQGQLQLSDTISYHLETKVTQLKEIFNFHIWYDYEYKLVRYDMLSNGPTINIHDYNDGVAYVINKESSQCTVSPISDSSFDVLPPSHADLNKTGYVLKLKNPIQLFDLSQRAQYIGQRTVRGVMCDVYEYIGDFNFGGKVSKAVHQFYFMAHGWHELSVNSGTSVLYQPIQLVITATDGSLTERYDFSDYTNQHSDLSNFNIQSCFQGTQKQDFQIKFNQTYHPTLDTQLAAFIRAVQRQLSNVTGISPLRFQNPEVTYDDPYTYYTATIVQQSPSIFDFTKTSGKQALHSSDAAFVGMMSDDQCAGVCRNMTSFNCLSFDYCHSTSMCLLSKQHISDGNLLNSSTVCDHYSRTVNSGSLIEATIYQALTMVQNRIARGTFSVDVHTNNNAIVSYPAMSLDRQIFRFDYGAANADTLLHFKFLKNMASSATPISRYYGIAVDDCASRCLSEYTYDCDSFTFCPDQGLCKLSDTNPDQNTSIVITNRLCELYTRKYTDMYTEYQGLSMPQDDGIKLTGISSQEACAKQCITYKKHTCKSFDYCDITRICYLRMTHLLDSSKTTLARVGGCNHFSRKYIYDFIQTPNRTINADHALTFSNISLDNCAKLCVENNAYTCKSFSMCGNPILCSIFVYSGIDTNITNSNSCDVYTRQLPPYQLPKANTQSKETSSGFGGGAMGGVAFGGLLLGIILGAALLFMLRTKQLLARRKKHGDHLVRGMVNGDDDDDLVT